MTTYTETTATWAELNMEQRQMVVDWFVLDGIRHGVTGLEFIIDDRGAVVGCTSELDSKWERE